MITHLTIRNFKAHTLAELPLANLNVFTGLNGVGKSSAIQALLLLRQSYLKNNSLHNGLLLNGELVEIGTGADALNSKGDNISFELQLDGTINLSWKFEKSLSANFLALTTPSPDEKHFASCSLFNNNFQYVSAEHISSFELHQRDTLQVEINRQISEKKGGGEFAVHFLQYYGQQEKVISESLKHPQEVDDSLRAQTDAWLSEISPGVRTVIRDNQDQNVLQLRFQFEAEHGYTSEFKPENVGFGIPYVLPVIIAILAAPKGSIVILENPEAHIHPYGQAKLAQLIALAAQAGVQIFLETHSDHIINGIQVAVKHFSKGRPGISHEQVRIYYFQRARGQTTTHLDAVPVSPEGKIYAPPVGFFDQIDQDLQALMGF
ncbi:MAG: AAA family ATPase [Saprospiraceae bacterium]